MGATLISAPCAYCSGTGVVESLEEYTPDGWVANTQLPHDLADAWIRADGNRAPVRWVTCGCPVCAGIGSYTLESTPARIF